MDNLNQEELQYFISEKVIKPFYEKRLSKLDSLTLDGILKRKNSSSEWLYLWERQQST